MFWDLFVESGENPPGGGTRSTRLSEESKAIIRNNVKKYKDTAISKNDLMRAIRAVYKLDPNDIEEIVNEVW